PCGASAVSTAAIGNPLVNPSAIAEPSATPDAVRPTTAVRPNVTQPHSMNSVTRRLRLMKNTAGGVASIRSSNRVRAISSGTAELDCATNAPAMVASVRTIAPAITASHTDLRGQTAHRTPGTDDISVPKPY